MVELKEYENTAEFQSYVKMIKRSMYIWVSCIGLPFCLLISLLGVLSGVLFGILSGSLLVFILIFLLIFLLCFFVIMCPLWLVAFILTMGDYRVCNITVVKKGCYSDYAYGPVWDVSGVKLGMIFKKVYDKLVVGNSYIVFMKGNKIIDLYSDMGIYGLWPLRKRK